MAIVAVESAVLTDPFCGAGLAAVECAALLLLPVVSETVHLLLERNSFLYFYHCARQCADAVFQ